MTGISENDAYQEISDGSQDTHIVLTDDQSPHVSLNVLTVDFNCVIIT